MFILRIEHPVPSFEAWEKAFASDPLGRRASGVRRYRVFRASDDPSYVLVDLEFERAADAEAMLVRLRELWGRVEGKLMSNARARTLELTASEEV